MPKQESELSPHPERENKLPQGELKVAVTELRKLFDNRFTNSEMNSVMNEGRKVIIPTQHISAPLYEPRWYVGLSKDIVEIRRITSSFYFAGTLKEETDEKITITTGILPSVRYEFKHQDNTGKKPLVFGGQYDNTRRAVAKCEEVINAIPQAAKIQKATPR